MGGDREDLERICVRNLLATPADRVFFKDLRSRFLMVSAGWALDHAPGRTVDELVGMSDFDFFSAEHAIRALEDEQQIIRTGDHMAAKIERLTYNDRPDAWVSTTKHPLRDDRGRIIGTFGISCDVTAQVLAEGYLAESEERFRSTFEQAPLGIFRLDTEGRVVDANRALCELVGRSPEELHGRLRSDLLDDLVSEPSMPSTGAARKAGLDEGGPRSSQGRVRRPDGTVRMVQVNDVVIHDQDGCWQTLIATVEDVTDRLQMAEDLRRAQQMEALGQLAGGIAHEINTPTQFISDNLSFLSTIWGPVADLLRAAHDAAARLRKGDVPGDVASVLEACCQAVDLDFVEAEVPSALSQSQEGVERVATIVRAMKAFGRPDLSSPEPTDINRLAANALTVARNELKYVAEVTVEYGTLPTVKCFPGAISQVLLNLLVNAAYAVGQAHDTTGERGRIDLRTWAEADQVCISITDTGPGIPQDVLPRIFQPFFTTKPFGCGTGQGLAMAWATVVDGHRGRIDVSTSDAGTSFTIRLPG
ncbi:MAG: PAS domain S-box protein [Acidimicrobiales bacterium]